MQLLLLPIAMVALISTAFADLGSFSKRGLIEVQLKDGSSVEGVFWVMTGGGYEGDSVPTHFEFLDAKKQILKNFTPDFKKSDQEVILTDIQPQFLRTSGQFKSSIQESDKLKIQTKFKSRCSKVQYREISVSDIKAIHFFNKLDSKKTKAALHDYSDATNLDGCNVMTWFGGDYGGSYFFTPRRHDNVTEVKRAIALIYTVLPPGLGFDLENSESIEKINPDQTPKDFRDDAPLFIDVARSKRDDQEDALQTKAKKWNKVWKVTPYEPASIMDDRETWIYPF